MLLKCIACLPEEMLPLQNGQVLLAGMSGEDMCVIFWSRCLGRNLALGLRVRLIWVETDGP